MSDFNKIVDTLELDKCQTDKERMAVLQKEIARREAELKPFRELYRAVFERIFSEWYCEFTTKFPDLVMQTFKGKDELWVEIPVGEIHYQIIICKEKKQLYCIARIKVEDYKKGKRLTDDIVHKLKNLMPWMRVGELMLERCSFDDYDIAFYHFCEIVECFLELQKAASKVEGVE